MTSVDSPPMQRLVRADARTSIGRVLDAARRLLGDGTVTLSRIAEEAGVGVATLYRHFPNRQVLARAVLNRVFDEEIDPLLAEFASGAATHQDLLTVAEQVVEVMRREIGVVQSVGNLHEVTAQFLGRDGRLRDTVARAQQAGNLRPDLDADDLPVLLAMVLTGQGVVDASPTVRRRYLSLLLDGLNPSGAVPLPPRGTAPLQP
ncbi:MAG: helix-turn-helix domain-containing protein [Propionicimonas sp.]|uniref:TetR/AcrR family transcriptional regulator n=1 Tax=Propionicimonas sp. TaxID=1955623 RepID=UPI002B218DCA|nr:helix-turn-helix domain-containing protein [Propionicimonas sp.]MEA4944515.1 helix-turn-helix domain-containing protein [Propionicimonas sp.]